MTVGEILWLLPLLLAVATVVGTAGHERGEFARAIRRSFIALVLGVAAVGSIVRVLVILFA